MILLFPKEVAERLKVSVKTLDGYADAGEIRYVDLSRGGKNKRRRYTPEFVEEFISRRTRRDVPCPSTAPKARRSTTTTSKSNVIGFTARRAMLASEKQKNSSG
ncbi:helix-turn-helix domain-containing protein [uncultured Bradyrhizobium sp.]|jgi:predicted site-specific integrase-resolvase|uniref:helix-turn-helix domain-containing protein n=1 Tax=uncultured Bradyrhizobium sp. TaxID=199684 RepID=UPI00345BA9A3